MSDTPSRLRILLVGASGTLGRAVHAELGQRHEIVTAGSKSGDVRIDLTEPGSLHAALSGVGQLDAVCCTAGKTAFAMLTEVDAKSIAESFYGLGIASKLMGQINLALASRPFLREGGSVTLISGILAQEPIPGGTSAAMVNGALESFVRAAANEWPHGRRINLVSPTVFVESMEAFGPYFRGFEPIPVSKAALAFSRSVEGIQTGQVFKVGY